MPPRGRPSAVSPSPRGRAGASPSPPPVKAVAKAAKKSSGFFSRHGNVYVYVPNLIGALQPPARAPAAWCSRAPRLPPRRAPASGACGGEQP